jgi:hypothetical protein
MGEAPFPNRPFKPLVERPRRGESFRAAPRSLRSVQARSLTPTCGGFYPLLSIGYEE